MKNFNMPNEKEVYKFVFGLGEGNNEPRFVIFFLDDKEEIVSWGKWHRNDWENAKNKIDEAFMACDIDKATGIK